MFINRLLRALRNSAYCGMVFFSLLQGAQAQPAPAPQEDRWYDVELLIFKYSNPEEFASENWPERWSLPDTANTVDIDGIDPKYRADFQRLETSSFGAMQEKLDKSVRYEVLNYSAWRQRGLGAEQAVSVHIRAGRRYQSPERVAAGSEFGLFEEGFVEQDLLPEVTIRRYTMTEAKTGNLLYELEGDVKIVLSRYLHVYADLLLLKPVTLTLVQPERKSTGARDPRASYSVAWVPDDTQAGAFEPAIDARETTQQTLYGFNIKAHRRMRSGELHHIDHPLLGILIQAKPVEAAKH
ncbi:MAG TPA: CsiV family protein [Gammaproteobacteria bacterium]|nr:CsiV family protein [Gammaproteobacteria bacterium]